MRGDRFKNEGLFGFRIRFGEDLGDGKTRVYALKKCPVIRMPHRGVIQIENRIGQFFLERMTAPNKTKRAGKRVESGPLFEDVTDKVMDYDVDFEALLAVRP